MEHLKIVVQKDHSFVRCKSRMNCWIDTGNLPDLSLYFASLVKSIQIISPHFERFNNSCRIHIIWCWSCRQLPCFLTRNLYCTKTIISKLSPFTTGVYRSGKLEYSATILTKSVCFVRETRSLSIPTKIAFELPRTNTQLHRLNGKFVLDSKGQLKLPVTSSMIEKLKIEKSNKSHVLRTSGIIL